jgi:hypothetical protein
MAKKKAYTLTFTYDIVTPESAENGDFAETGFCFQDGTPCSAKQATTKFKTRDELLSFIKAEVWPHSSYEFSHSHWYELDSSLNYSDASEKRVNFHVDGPDANSVDEPLGVWIDAELSTKHKRMPKHEPLPDNVTSLCAYRMGRAS